MHAVLRNHQHGLGPEGLDQRTGQQHRGDNAVHLGLFVGQQHKSGEDVHQVALVNVFNQPFGRVQRHRLAAQIAAALVQNAAYAVAAGVQVHQLIKIFAQIQGGEFLLRHHSNFLILFFYA